jgi:hypothetical protein
MDAQTGKYIAPAAPLGTVTEGMVIKRAKEIAATNDRNGNDYTVGNQTSRERDEA